MSILTLLLIALGVSADAFAVSLGKGLQQRRLTWGTALAVAATFGGFQGVMPLIGWALGTGLSDYVTAIDHWIAFGLLAAVGGKMLWEAFQGPDEDDVGPIQVGELLVLGVATSIDALAVGISFAFLDVPIGGAVVLIGATTFLVSLAGVFIGHRVGLRFQKPAEIAGGVILILIGLRILLDHLGVW
ncbi:putative manganese efflux pump MntP [metagenome]|uniref:Putative manganese efflux pump MntP n=1 Tax=metagenome TaxID=256318 RepID=A0A2P2C9W3_9ZZZZ